MTGPYVFSLIILAFCNFHRYFGVAACRSAVSTFDASLGDRTSTVDLSSAVAIAAAASVKSQQRSGTIPAIVLPKNGPQGPGFDIVSRLAPALPIMQAHTRFQEVDSMISDLIAASKGSENTSNAHSRPGVLRVMIVGDSMTHGQQGDWTWRYRIWQWFQQNNIAVEFVGPYRGTLPPPDPNPNPPRPPPLYEEPIALTSVDTGGGYNRGVDVEFLSNDNHFAVWGRAVATDKGLIRDVLLNHPADLLLVMLGFNDMGWFYSDAGGTIESMSTFIDEARSASPDIKFAIANVPMRLFMTGRDDLVGNTTLYNHLLPLTIANRTTSQSPIRLVRLEEEYACEPEDCPAGYDGLHPNAWGDVQIASAFSKSLHEDFGLGDGPLSVPPQDDPSLERDLPVPSNFQVFSSPQGVTALWDPVYGAFGYDVAVSVNGEGPGSSATGSNRWDSQWPQDGWIYSVAVRASAGNTIKGNWSATKSAVARPQLPEPPTNVTIDPTEDGFVISWNPPSGSAACELIEYNVIYWDFKSTEGQSPSAAAFKSSPARITGLNPGSNYLVAPLSWNRNGQGWPTLANNVVPGARTPRVPTGLDIVATDATTVHLKWDGDRGAGGYHIWSRNIDQDGSEFSIVANITDGRSCHDQGLLFPRASSYHFAISAFNGNRESDRSVAKAARSLLPGVSGLIPDPSRPPAESWYPEDGKLSGPLVISSPQIPIIA